MAERNTSQLWDDVWAARSPSVEKDLYAVAKEERLIRWQRIEAKILERFGAFAGLSIVELGAGRGTNAALMAHRGARVTVLDYSQTALDRSRRLFDNLGLPVELVLQDALELPDDLRGRYDVSMSFGLAEHFLGDPRAAIVRAHFDVLKPGGIAFVSVPNAHNPPYRLYKWITERTGRWTIGEEYPFSRRELERHCRALGLDNYGFFGDSLWRSKKFLNPIKWVPRRRRTARPSEPSSEAGSPSVPAGVPIAAGQGALDPAAGTAASGSLAAAGPASSKRRYRRLPSRERGTRWDDRYSYALVLWGEKPR
jgi:SAM-dependent methyltransferase